MENQPDDTESKSAPIFLFRVEEVFEIEGRGCVLVPGIPHSFPLVIKRGDRLAIHRHDGSAIQTTLKDLPLINSTHTRHSTAILLPRDVHKADVPTGSEIWLESETKHSGIH